ncbi:holo-[acyl-carrier-protein] synthase [Desulfovibrio psychrotolerans]|nr:holo-[acyl-carrier-protein] synthase [Desulfovibrio psychrotolerans]
MIVGLGLDVCELDRIRRSWERFGQRFAARILHPNELNAMPADPVAYLAARFAAREAAVKALGTGFAQGIGFHDIEIARLPSGKPHLLFHGNATKVAGTMGVTRHHISITHGRDVACAVVVLES